MLTVVGLAWDSLDQDAYQEGGAQGGGEAKG